MNQIKITPETKIDSTENQSITSNSVKEPGQETSKKNSFEEVLKKISELRKGKTFATEEKDSNFYSHLSEKKNSELDELVTKNSSCDETKFPETYVKKSEKDLSQEAENLKVENAINPELQSILLGSNTQIITAKGIEANTQQLIAYARKAGLNENAISVLLKNNVKTNTLFVQTNLHKHDIPAAKENEDLIANTFTEKESKSNLTPVKENLQKKTLPHELLINNESKSKTSFINTNTPKASRKLEIESDETVDVEKSKNFKMLMKVKDENFLEKLIVKKLEEEKSPSTNKIERLQSIELGVRGSQFISSLLTMRNSEISQSNKVSEIDSNLYSQSSSSFVSKLESSTSSGHQQGSSREQQSEQIQIKRQEQFQQMAQRLGETLAKRIIEQISRGAWRVQIALKPASLGNIEISLNLRGKEIEASFHAPQALTRELLAESLPKLKDSLEKAGMNVAEMNVTGQNESKSDKNSTNKENKDKEIKINEIKIDSKDDEKTKESISNADHSGGLNILV